MSHVNNRTALIKNNRNIDILNMIFFYNHINLSSTITWESLRICNSFTKRLWAVHQRFKPVKCGSTYLLNREAVLYGWGHNQLKTEQPLANAELRCRDRHRVRSSISQFCWKRFEKHALKSLQINARARWHHRWILNDLGEAFQSSASLIISAPSR